MKKLFAVLFILVTAGLYGQERLAFVRITGGTFLMGTPTDEPGRHDDEGPQRPVTVSSFYIGKNPVTVGEFRSFVNATGYRTEAETRNGGWVWTGIEWQVRPDANWRNPYFTQGENHPVVLVSWNDAIRYANWLSEQEGLTPAYTISGTTVTWNRSANGYRLPAEAEWEYACRAGTTTPWNTGTNITQAQANFWVQGAANPERTSTVGSYAANAWGLYDMHGNVWEWCWDWYGEYASDAQIDPIGTSSGSGRVLRGGSWSTSAASLRSSRRNYGIPASRTTIIGFRLVRP